jgi:hypothetical protein
MLKSITLAALAAVSMSALAQSTSWDNTSMHGNLNKDAVMISTDRSGAEMMYDRQKSVMMQANMGLTGGDAYYLERALDHLPSNVEQALLWGLYNSRANAVSIRDEYARMRQEEFARSWQSGNRTVVTNWNWNDPNWNSTMTWSDEQAMTWRPMRMIMAKPMNMRNISYLEAMSILTAGADATTAGTITNFFMESRDERLKDIIVRLLRNNASLIDMSMRYPSTMMPPAIPLSGRG